MIPITVHVPEARVEDFYARFGEFISKAPEPDAPLIRASGTVPAWVESDEAKEIASSFWSELSVFGNAVLTFMARQSKNETSRLRPSDIVEGCQLPNKVSKVAGILGGVGRAARKANLPMYRTPQNDVWHYLWTWDGEFYSMTPEVAKLLRMQRP